MWRFLKIVLAGTIAVVVGGGALMAGCTYIAVKTVEQISAEQQDCSDFVAAELRAAGLKAESAATVPASSETWNSNGHCFSRSGSSVYFEAITRKTERGWQLESLTVNHHEMVASRPSRGVSR